MNDFKFLDGLLFADDKPNKKCPEDDLKGLTLRVYETGAVIPSLELCNEFNLEYGEGTNGVDFFLAHKWGAYPKDQPNFLIFTAVPRTESKISLFNKDGESIMTVKHRSSELVDCIKTLVPTAFDGPDARGHFSRKGAYVDITIEKSKPITTSNNIYYIPKLIERGENKGKETYVKRENITLYPMNMPRPAAQSVITTYPDTSSHTQYVTIEQARATYDLSSAGSATIQSTSDTFVLDDTSF